MIFTSSGEQIEPGLISTSQFVFAPRVFTRCSIREVAKRLRENERMSFIMRYLKRADARFAQNAMDKWGEKRLSGGYRVQRSPDTSPVRFFFSVTDVLRCLFKLGINALAAFCRVTPVRKDTFPAAIGHVMSPASTRDLVKNNGFVHAADIQCIAVANCHAIRMQHAGGMWHVYFAFFGGKIGAVVRFPGPNDEDWVRADAVFPIRQKKYDVQLSKILLPMKTHVSWSDTDKIMPSMEIKNPEAEIDVMRFTPPTQD